VRDIAHTQNFLTSARLVEQLVEQADIDTDDLVLEIGPGRGIITSALADRAGQVIAVEKDAALAKRLQRRFSGRQHVHIVSADILRIPLPRTPYKVFASLPFNATSDIMARLLAAATLPDDLHVIIQREAAERFSGAPRETLVAVLLKPWFEPSIVHKFRRSDFMPAPRVDVVMLRLRKRGPPLVVDADAQLFRDFVAYGFTAWQRSVADALESLLGRTHARQAVYETGLPLHTPPSLVPFACWLHLFEHLKANHRRRLAAQLAGAERRLRQQQHGLQKRHRTPSRWTRRPPPHALAV
jgi:23S rRNA (adenine-N6)-dimethyltransferase